MPYFSNLSFISLIDYPRFPNITSITNTHFCLFAKNVSVFIAITSIPLIFCSFISSFVFRIFFPLWILIMKLKMSFSKSSFLFSLLADTTFWAHLLWSSTNIQLSFIETNPFFLFVFFLATPPLCPLLWSHPIFLSYTKSY